MHLAACDNFTTVLAPGYNAAHYNHIHVDLMRRSSGERPCRPEAVPGDVAAAKARAIYARQRGPAYTGSVAQPAAGKRGNAPIAIPGEDGDIDFEYSDEFTTGAIGAPTAPQISAGTRQSVLPADRMGLH